MKHPLLIFALIMALGQSTTARAQTEPERTFSSAWETWLSIYTDYRVAKRFAYYGEYHVRGNNFYSSMDKIYLRFGLIWMVQEDFELTLGVATPIGFNQSPDDPDTVKVALEYRIWEQALFVGHVGRSKVYHQLRFEQRWKRKYYVGADYIFSTRWRYRFTVYIPLNHDSLRTGTVFLPFYDEVFIQVGKDIPYFEDNRLFGGVGYVAHRNLNLQLGLMWTFHQKDTPYEFEHKYVVKLAIYHSFDFFKKAPHRRTTPTAPHNPDR